MNLQLTRPLAFFDLEATGKDVAHDRIVEIGIVRLFPDGTTDEYQERFNPCIRIPEEATAIHGITDADVKHCPLFDDVSEDIFEHLEGCDLAGFNLLNYDVPLLWEEFSRAGIEWNLEGVKIVDAGNIFKKQEQRTLSAAMKFYCGREHKDAHSALADVKATADVLLGQTERYTDLGTTVDDLAAASKMDDHERIDLAGKLIRTSDGIARYGFGNKRGTAVAEDPSFATWMLGKDFSKNTLLAVRKVLDDEVYRRPVKTQSSMARAFAMAGSGDATDPFADE